MSVRTRITGVLSCVVAILALASLAFSRGVLVALIEDGGLGGERSMLTAVSLALTGPVALAAFLVACLAVVASAGLIARAEAGRLVVQLAVLMAVVLLVAIALAGFMVPFVMPVVRLG